jgi:hypothetical protein
MGQCKYEHWGFKKAKERAWDSASLRVKTLIEVMLKNGFEKTWYRESKERVFKEQKRRL